MLLIYENKRDKPDGSELTTGFLGMIRQAAKPGFWCVIDKKHESHFLINNISWYNSIENRGFLFSQLK